MNLTPLRALYVALLSLALAIIFNFLFFGKQPGISVLIFAVVFLFATFLLGRKQSLSFKKSWWQVCLIVFFALMPAIRANPFLIFLDVCATLGLLMLFAHQLAGTPTFLMKLGDYIVLIVVVPLRMLRKAVSTVFALGQVHSSVKNRDVWLRVIKGVIMAVPVLIVLAVLFSQADLAFKQFLSGFVHITISQRSVQYLVLLFFAFVAALGSLSYMFFPKQTEPSLLQEQPEVVTGTGNGIEIVVFLGLIAALFLVFIIFQITYLFGGETNIVNAGFTYAEYARRGFWELLAAAFLSLLVLLASEKYAGAESKTNRKFLIPSLILIAEVVVVIVSAFKRLSLYIDAYGLTLMRFFVAGFIILLLVLFILLAIKFIRSKPERFYMFGSLLSVAAFLIAINIINPDAFIAKANLKQYDQTGKVDVKYLRELSVDAEPWKAVIYKRVQGEDKQNLKRILFLEKEDLEKNSAHWQSANLARSRALRLLGQMGDLDPTDNY